MKQGLVVAPLVTTTAAMVVAQEAVAPEKVIFVCEHGAASKATHIFAIGCTLPSHAASRGKAGNWDDVPDDQGYAAQRDAIKKHVERLLDQLQNR